MMQRTEYNVVYVDRRARRDRVQLREDLWSASTAPAGTEAYEDDEVVGNLRCLLEVFNAVSICTSGTSCVSVLSEVDRSDPTPTLVLLDVPWHPQPEEEADEGTCGGEDSGGGGGVLVVGGGHEVTGRHDSGVVAADMLYGLPLLKFICNEVDALRMSSLVVPVAVLTNRYDPATHPTTTSASATIPLQPNGVLSTPQDRPRWTSDNSRRQCFEERELRCIDIGAVDVLVSPIPMEKAKAMYVHCYRARRNVQRARRVSWVGVDEQKVPAREQSEYAYLREKMVSELMADICKPKKTKFFSRGSHIRISPGRLEKMKRSISSWGFSAHDFTDEELGYCAKLMLEHALQMPEVEEYRIPSDRIMDFLTACRAAYNPKIPYHNFRHVVDVLQAVFYFLLQLRALPPYPAGGSADCNPGAPLKGMSCMLTPLDALTLLVAAIGHDVGHPGVNNAFLITLKAPLAQVYNDRSVLESFHCAAFSQVLRKYWPKTLELRKALIEMILATDMGLHFDYMRRLDKMKERAMGGGWVKWGDREKADCRTLICALLVKCADISNVARSYDCSAQWAEILLEEFARQASMESDLGIPSSLVVTPVVGSVLALANSQVNFMKLFALPLFQSLSQVLPEMRFSVDNLTANEAMWAAKTEDEAVDKLSGKPSPDDRGGGARGGGGGGGGGGGFYGTHAPVVMEASLRSSQEKGPLQAANQHQQKQDRQQEWQQRSPSPVAIFVTKPSTATTTTTTAPSSPPSSPFTDDSDNDGNLATNEKYPHQHSTDHLSANTTDIPLPPPDRPRSSPPSLSTSTSTTTDHNSCPKSHCGATTTTTTILTASDPLPQQPSSPPTMQIQRRPSRFFKKVRLWKSWRRESEV